MVKDPNRRNRAAIKFTIVGLLFFVLASALGAAVGHWVTEIFTDNFPVALTATLGLFGLAGFVLLTQYDRVNEQITATAELVTEDRLADRDFLICGYSLPFKPRKTGDPDRLKALYALDLSDVEGRAGAIARSEDQAPLFNWQQNVRVMNRMPNLRKVYVISPDRDHFERFEQVISSVFSDRREKISFELLTGKECERLDRGDGKQLSICFKGDSYVHADYDNYNYVTAAIEAAFERIRTEHGLSRAEMQRRVAIDATAGTKIFSTAAAVASLNREIVFTYAKTTWSKAEGPGGILVYDARVELFGEGLVL